ncbi:3-hydroxyanthranilate 3,4-dioxygenase [Hartmannibacter diazotrophicus]|uniref:3-hydroxyanthranilate 3,4-dioxygenase n=1 Tax=Hartmannibacter diazotrophicus TaxID=1482074 RepID=A0A2C9DB47_9HYPH|nr:cupin domain-containing protein [Hartmannibacter diazotrophicus]SON57517.1 3-hydroxyanthranilate 3,4-dioxygenase [Hartmannibacter diazotrophicus]
MKAVNLAEKLAQFSSHWDPHVVADYNANDVMVVKFKGEFPFHKHDTTDDFFLVLEGEMVMDIEGEPSRTVKAGELFVVPKGVVHRPRAEAEVKVLLIEPKGEPNSGDSGREPAPKPRI